jgi:hypothetical protein
MNGVSQPVEDAIGDGGQTDSLSEIDLTQPTINDLQAIAG